MLKRKGERGREVKERKKDSDRKTRTQKKRERQGEGETMTQRDMKKNLSFWSERKPWTSVSHWKQSPRLHAWT